MDLPVRKPDRNERNIAANLTILSGDIGVAVDSTDNSYRVLIADNVDATAILDGFTIEEGNADGGSGFAVGGGIYIQGRDREISEPLIENCTFRNNYGGSGGAMGIEGLLGGRARPIIRNTVFEDNTNSLLSAASGGAIFMTASAGSRLEPAFISCTFRG